MARHFEDFATMKGAGLGKRDQRIRELFSVIGIKSKGFFLSHNPDSMKLFDSIAAENTLTKKIFEIDNF